jgi:thiosulfate/3-mercaptopyruvate sulfurtransferase
MAFKNPQHLVSTEWLALNLSDPALRLLDCTVFLRPPDPATGRRAFTIESGRANYDTGHIPGAAFADLAHDLSDRDSPLRFTMPAATQFAAAMGRYGVGPGTRVVCYDANMSMWAARVWWMLKSFGFTNAAVLDGGWKKWTLEGRPVSTAPSEYAAATFAAAYDPARIASKQDVLAAIGDGATCIVNALTPEQHRGEAGGYGRLGRIAGSVNVSARDLIDRETGAYLPPDVLASRFRDVAASSAERVITYCGGGIAATSDALVLTLLGHDNVAVYDASMSEWAQDPDTPMEAG